MAFAVDAAVGRVQAEALRGRGIDVLLVTTDQHPESDKARDYELVLDPRFRVASTWPAVLAAQRRVREYRPDIVIAELGPRSTLDRTGRAGADVFSWCMTNAGMMAAIGKSSRAPYSTGGAPVRRRPSPTAITPQ